jgi:hypothetical protein
MILNAVLSLKNNKNNKNIDVPLMKSFKMKKKL